MSINTRKLTHVAIVSDDATAAERLRKRLEDNFSVAVTVIYLRGKTRLRNTLEIKPDIVFVDFNTLENAESSMSDYLSDIATWDAKVVVYAGREIDMTVAECCNVFGFLPKSFCMKDLYALMTRFYESKLAIFFPPPPETD